MSQTDKLKWLKIVLLAKVIVCLFVWGLPGLIGPAWMLATFGIQMPADPFYLRMFGAVITGVALLYWFAYRDPLRNRDILRYAVVDNALSTLAIVFVALTSGLSSWFFYVSGALTFLFFVAFWVLLPEKQ
jgi:hypothetical protein